MIKCRLRASVLYQLFTGGNGLVSARKMVIPFTRRLSYIRVVDSVQSKGSESLKRPLHNSTNYDDDFAELGLPVERGGDVILKLMTEKPEPFLKINGTKKKSNGSSFKADSCLDIKDVSTKEFESLPVERGGGVSPKLMTEKPEPFLKINGTKKKSHGSSFKAESCLNIKDVWTKGFESLNWPLQTSTNDDDDFEDLGLPVERGGGVIPKLMTEKRESFLKINGTKKKSHGSSFKADSCLNIEDVSTKVGNSSPVPSLDLENNNDGRSYFRTSSSVTIKNVPSIISLLELKEAILVFGKVSKASKRSVPNGLDCCDIEFKSKESSMTALSIGKITVKNFNLPICPLNPLETVTIRISNIRSETAESAIHSTCTLCGPLEGLVRTKEDAVDALFRVKGEADTKSILERLNSTVMDESKWLAHLQHSKSPSTAMTENDNAQDDLGLKISVHLADLNREISLKKICAEDLEYLHHSLLHLENHPLKADIISPTSTEL